MSHRHAGNICASGYAVWWAARRAQFPYLVYVNGGDPLRKKRKARRLAGRHYNWDRVARDTRQLAREVTRR